MSSLASYTEHRRRIDKAGRVSPVFSTIFFPDLGARRQPGRRFRASVIARTQASSDNRVQLSRPQRGGDDPIHRPRSQGAQRAQRRRLVRFEGRTASMKTGRGSGAPPASSSAVDRSGESFR